MPKFAANVTTMFPELSMSERMKAARECGFSAVEFLFPYEWSPDEINGWAGRSELEIILINTYPGESAGLAAVVGSEARFRESFESTLQYAKTLSVPMIHLMAGRAGEGREVSDDVFVENVQWAANSASDLTILLEPLNTLDMPGYLHTSTAHTARLLDAIDRPNVKMQFDFYHMQVMEGHLVRSMEEHFDRIGHVQFSSVPGRHEPQYGEVNVDFLFEWLDQAGYKGWIGCEYKPKGVTRDGLSWARPWGLSPE